MFVTIPSRKNQFTAFLALQNKTGNRIQLRVLVKDMTKANTMYIDRIIIVEPARTREIKLQFPMSGDYMQLQVYNEFTSIPANAEDSTFAAVITKIGKLETKDMWTDANQDAFVKFAEEFSANAGLLSIGKYRSNDGKFRIWYMPYLTITDNAGNELISNTPSRIGQETGKIEVSQRHFLQYTAPMRFIILLHEYSHKWHNPKVNKKMEDEVEADLNALYIYLSRGYPRTDAKEVYLNIFLKSRTEENLNRYRKIDEFIQRFEKK